MNPFSVGDKVTFVDEESSYFDMHDYSVNRKIISTLKSQGEEWVYTVARSYSQSIVLEEFKHFSSNYIRYECFKPYNDRLQQIKRESAKF